MSVSLNTFDFLVFSHLAINTPNDFRLFAKNLDLDRYSEEDYETLEKQTTHILKDKELQTWWENKTTKKTAKYGNGTELKEEQEELDGEYLDQIYDVRYHIGLDAYTFLRNYLRIYENLELDALPEDWSEEKRTEVFNKYPEFMGARQLQRNSPEIYKLGYLDKIKIRSILITKVKFKLLDNKFTLQEDEGFTLNSIAYLAGNLFKVNFWFNDYYRKNACIFMHLKLSKAGNTLICSIACDT